MVLLGTCDLLAVQWVRVAALDLHHGGLLHLIGYDSAGPRFPGAACLFLIHLRFLIHLAAPSLARRCSVSTVLSRATSRLSVRSSMGFSNSMVAERKRRRNSSSSSCSIRASTSSTVSSRISVAFILHLHGSAHARRNGT